MMQPQTLQQRRKQPAQQRKRQQWKRLLKKAAGCTGREISQSLGCPVLPPATVRQLPAAALTAALGVAQP